MKKAVLIAVCLFALLILCSCSAKEQNNMETNTKTVNVINSVNDADIWILPETQENLKTTLWGTATVSKINKGESRQAPLCEPGDNGNYIFRMIDTDKFYYSANSVTLDEGYTLEIKGEQLNSVLEVKDENGNLINTYKVFSARL